MVEECPMMTIIYTPVSLVVYIYNSSKTSTHALDGNKMVEMDDDKIKTCEGKRSEDRMSRRLQKSISVMVGHVK